MIRLNDLQLFPEGQRVSISVEGKSIAAVDYSFQPAEPLPGLHFGDAIAFPGLINSHDHLEFNCYPQLGHRIYNNYREWSEDVQKNDRELIDAVLKIPESLRAQWGVYKNLLCGVTTVVNHGKQLKLSEQLITIMQQNEDLHSVAFEKNWKRKLNDPFSKEIVVMHIGEGTDDDTNTEIDSVLKWNVLKKKLIAVHGVAMKEAQAADLEALIWCPDSNFFLLGKTAEISKLKKQTPILFGTDSTLSAGWNLWDHLHMARNTGAMSDKELFETITENAARVWGFSNKGRLQEHFDADIVVARKPYGASISDAFYSTTPENILLVMQEGAIRLFDETLLQQIDSSGIPVHRFNLITVGGVQKYIAGDLPLLKQQILEFCPSTNFPF